MQNRYAYQGWETLKNSVLMTYKMHVHIFYVLLFLMCVIFGVLGFMYLDREILPYTVKFIYAACVSLLYPNFDIGISYEGKQYIIPASKAIELLRPIVRPQLKEISLYLFFSSFVFALYPVLLAVFKRRAENQADARYIGGARLVSTGSLNRAMRSNREKLDIPIGPDVRMPVSAEVKHTLVIGRPGTGKTVCISQKLERLKAREKKGIVYDFKGDYTEKFYNPETDILFNPLDKRSVGWNIYNDLKTFMDIDAASHSLIPPAYSGEPFWNDAARDVFAGVLHYLYQNNLKSNADIWSAVSSPVSDISDWLKKTPGAERGYVYIQDASGKQALSVMAVLMQYVKAFEYMTACEGDFSVNDWVSNGKGWIFITNYPDCKDSLKPILSLFIDLLSRRLLSLPDDYGRRLPIIIDEFGTLQRLSSIVSLLTLSRSKGGAVWIGIQDIGQIDRLYTPQLRQSLINACGNSVIFGVGDPDTAEYLSRKIGETEYYKIKVSKSIGVSENRDGETLMEDKVTEKLVLPSDITNLKELEAFVSLANYPLTKTKLEIKKYAVQSVPYIIREDMILANRQESKPDPKYEDESNERQPKILDPKFKEETIIREHTDIREIEITD